MGSKRKIVVGGIMVLFLIITYIVIRSVRISPHPNYAKELLLAFQRKETASVSEIFSFEFDRAYIFDDCYISGSGLADRYNLKISIQQVEPGVSESIQRIVFVDAQGNYLYLFQCDRNSLEIKENGVIIYPDTLIRKDASAQKEATVLLFESNEFYNVPGGQVGQEEGQGDGSVVP